MPLAPGSSRPTVSKNIREFHTGLTYAHTKEKYGAKRANAQAVAVALGNARKYGAKFAPGGDVGDYLPAVPGPKPIQPLNSGQGSPGQGGSSNQAHQGMLKPLVSGASNLYHGYNADGSMSGNQWAQAGQGQGPAAAIDAPFASDSAIYRQGGSTPKGYAFGGGSPYQLLRRIGQKHGLFQGQIHPAAAPKVGLHAGVAGPPKLPGPPKPPGMNLQQHFAHGGAVHEGFIHSAIPGRTDKIPLSVEGGAYVVPSQHVAAIGQDNSLSGAAILDKMFKQGRYSRAAPRFASGGTPAGPPVKIIAAGGEYVLSPRAIIAKYGDLDKGHKALDHWIMTRRKKHAKTIANLASPKKD